jgi:hypothetical protein
MELIRRVAEEEVKEEGEKRHEGERMKDKG